MASADDYLELCDELSNQIHNAVANFLDEKTLDPPSASTIVFTVLAAYCAIIVQSSGGTKEDFMRSLEKCYDHQEKDISV